MKDGTNGKGPIIRFPSEEEERQSRDRALAEMRAVILAAREDALRGQEALTRLMEMLKGNHTTGQAYKLRALLYSLWNGQAASLVEVVNLDRKLRRDFCAVVQGFGYEDDQVKFFYDAIRDGFKGVGLYDWFLEEFKSKEKQ